MLDYPEILKDIRLKAIQSFMPYNSFYASQVWVDNRIIAIIVTFKEDYISKETTYSTVFTSECHDVKNIITHGYCHDFISSQSNSVREIAVTNQIQDIFGELSQADIVHSKTIDFSNWGDSPLFYLNGKSKINSSILYYELTGEQFSISSDAADNMFEVFGFNPSKLNISTPHAYFIFEKQLVSINRSRIIKHENGNESLMVDLRVGGIRRQLKYLQDAIAINVELIDKNKKVFYSKAMMLSELVHYGDFVEPHLIIDPNDKAEIYSSKIYIYINNQLHDFQEGTYIRNISVNVVVGGKPDEA